MSISQFLKRAAMLWPDREAVVDGDIRLNYRQFYKRAASLAASLISNGLSAQSVVSIVAPNSHEFLECYLACASVGIILNPINFRLSAREIEAIISDAGSGAVIVHTDFQETLREALVLFSQQKPDAMPLVISFGKSEQGRQPQWLKYEDLVAANNLIDFEPPLPGWSEVANLYYTSGTTGSPKGVMLTHQNITSHALCVIAELSLTDADNWLHAAPLFHLADAWATFAITAVGGKHVILPYFNAPGALAMIEEEQITLSNLIPTMLNAMINEPLVDTWSYKSLRLILSGGAPISPEMVRKIIKTFSCQYVQTYGMTETSPYLTLSLPKEHMKNLAPEKLLQVRSRTGRAFMGVELKVVREDGTPVAKDDREVGEIIARGPIVTPGYWKKTAETQAAIRAGWLYTGDLAVIDSNGYLNIVDRKKDMIITGGENVYSTEVEYVLYEHPAVLECAVFGVPDETWGESVTAAVVLKSNKQVLSEHLIQFVKERIAHFKAPRKIEFLDCLPKTGSGKIQKKVLRDRHIV